MIYCYPGLERAKYIDSHYPSEKKDVPPKYWNMIGYDNYKIHLSHIAQLLRENNIEFVSTGMLDPKATAINEGAGIKNMFPFGAFLVRKGLVYNDIKLENDGHMTVRGHTLCAEYLYECLKDVWKNKEGEAR